MIRYILALSLLCCHAQAATIPEQVARKAINGYFGELQEWQRVGYTRILDRGTTEKTAWITPYWIGEPGVDDETASGRKVELGRTAAMLEPRWGEIPYGTFVLISTAEDTFCARYGTPAAALTQAALDGAEQRHG